MKKIENIIVKFLTNTANIDELKLLADWQKKPKNKGILKSFVKVNYAIDMNMRQYNTENAKREYLRKIKRDKRFFYRYRFHKIWKYAAAVVVVFGLSYLFLGNVFNGLIERKVSPTIVSTSTIQPGTDKAILTLEDGSVVALEKGESIQTQNANSNGERVVYKSNQVNTGALAYNYLTIPRGGQFYVVLSDGTKVWLNSESQLKYPVSFVDGDTRQVELMYGEAYFDVTQSAENKGSKFIVLNDAQEVEVLGTEFNIKAYKGDSSISTTLVEGKVVVKSSLRTQVIKPNEQTVLNLEKNTMTISGVNVYNEVSWKEGVFSFEKKPLEEIMKVLSRWYDIQVVFENEELKGVTFTGVLGKNQRLEDVLVTLKTLSSIEGYDINNKTITLK